MDLEKPLGAQSLVSVSEFIQSLHEVQLLEVKGVPESCYLLFLKLEYSCFTVLY